MWPCMNHVSGTPRAGAGISGDPAGWDLRRRHLRSGRPRARDPAAARGRPADCARCGSRRRSHARAEIADPRLTFVHANFRDLPDAARPLAASVAIDGVLFDLGVSSMQLDDAERGFSLGKGSAARYAHESAGRAAAPTTCSPPPARASLPTSSFILARSARRAASRARIVARRARGTLPKTTTEFARCVSGVVHRPGRRERIHPATRVFQALRIAVNDELDALRDGLAGADRPPARRRTHRRHQLPFARRPDREADVPRRRAPRRAHQATARCPTRTRWRRTAGRAARSCAPRNGRRARWSSARFSRTHRRGSRNPRTSRAATQTRIVRDSRGRATPDVASASLALGWRARRC